jgi:hypothetical protein
MNCFVYLNRRLSHLLNSTAQRHYVYLHNAWLNDLLIAYVSNCFFFGALESGLIYGLVALGVLISHSAA